MYISYIPQTYENLIVSAQLKNTSVPDVITLECKDTNLFAIVLEALANKKKITFSNLVKDLQISDLIISESGHFGKQGFIFALYNEAMKYFGVIPQYSYFRFSYLNNIFASKGIYLHSNNIEDFYISVLKLKNPELENFAQELIKVMQELNQYEKLYQCWINAKNKMMETNDEKILEVILLEAQDFFSSSQKNFLVLDDSYFSTIRGKYESLGNTGV